MQVYNSLLKCHGHFYQDTYMEMEMEMEIYVRVLVRSNIARRQERNINYAPERVHISSHTYFMTPPSEPQKTQNISGSLSVVTSIGHPT